MNPAGPRPRRPSIAELRAVVQPYAVLARANAEHWTGTLYMRRVSVHLTWLLVRTPITANGVTILMIAAGFLAGPALLLPGVWGALLAVVFTQLQMLLDCSDGEVARWRRMASPKGIFLDAVGHYAAEGSIGLFLGLKAANLFGIIDASPLNWMYAFMGALLLAGIWLNKSLNMMVTVARVNAGLDKLPDEPQVRAVPPQSLVGQAKRLARFLPAHRMFHSIELTLVTLAFAVVVAGVGGGLMWWQAYVASLLVIIWLVTAGHLLAIWKSPRLASA